MTLEFGQTARGPDPNTLSSQRMQNSGDAIIDIDSRAITLNGEAPQFTKSQIYNEIFQTINVPLEDYSIGYPRQAAFQSSEPGWSIYRGFKYLHARVILELQDELRCLERELEDLEMGYYEGGEGRRLRSRQGDLYQAKREQTESVRAELLRTIQGKLVSYDEMLTKARELNAFQKPSKRDYRNFRTWFWNVKPLGYEAEEEFIKRKEDLVSLRLGREWSSFDGLHRVEPSKIPQPLSHRYRIFSTPEDRLKTNDEHIYYYSQSRIEKLVGLLIAIIIFVLLLLPVIAMYKLTSLGQRDSALVAAGIMIAFTLLFSAALSILTKARRHEIFAASAAYCLVLLVLISNFTNNGTK